jgi:hypothetical protein
VSHDWSFAALRGLKSPIALKSIAVAAPSATIPLMKPRLSKMHWGYRGWTKRFVLLATALLLLQLVCAGRDDSPLPEIDRQLSNGRQLSSEDVTAVMKLAQKAGITNIAKISQLDSEDLNIRVIGKERVNGRTVTFESLLVRTEGLMQHSIRLPARGVWTEGKFWAAYNSVYTNIVTLFEANGRTIQVRVRGKVSLEEAERLVATLTAGKIRYADAETEMKAHDHADLTVPEGIFLSDKGWLRVAFSRGLYGHASFKCVFADDWVILSDPIRIQR